MVMIERLQMRLQMPRSISSAGRVPGAAIAHPCESADASTRRIRQTCQSLVRASRGIHPSHRPSYVTFTTQVLLPLRLIFCCFYDSSQPDFVASTIQVDWTNQAFRNYGTIYVSSIWQKRVPTK